MDNSYKSFKQGIFLIWTKLSWNFKLKNVQGVSLGTSDISPGQADMI